MADKNKTEKRKSRLVWDPIDGAYRRYEWDDFAEMWVEVWDDLNLEEV